MRAGSDVAFMKREIVSVQAGGSLERRMAVQCVCFTLCILCYLFAEHRKRAYRAFMAAIVGWSIPGHIFNIFNVSHAWITRPLFPVSSRFGEICRPTTSSAP